MPLKWKISNLDAAQTINADRFEEVRKQLCEIGEDRTITGLGPVERSEAIRLFAFRKLPIPLMKQGLKAVEVLSVITNIDHETMALFVADLYKMFKLTPGAQYQYLLDQIYEIIRGSPASPSEFIAAFRASRRIALSGEIDPKTYFNHLKVAIEKGIPPEEAGKYIWDRMQQ